MCGQPTKTAAVGDLCIPGTVYGNVSVRKPRVVLPCNAGEGSYRVRWERLRAATTWLCTRTSYFNADLTRRPAVGTWCARRLKDAQNPRFSMLFLPPGPLPVTSLQVTPTRGSAALPARHTLFMLCMSPGSGGVLVARYPQCARCWGHSRSVDLLRGVDPTPAWPTRHPLSACCTLPSMFFLYPLPA